ncbi:TFIIH/NER complex subunit [Podila humilis]|nr:TFIIH/NER complex subunit [Podila humilis]
MTATLTRTPVVDDKFIFTTDDDVCPVCSTDRYLKPSMRLLVGPCFHKMCDNCIDRLFAHGPAPCPTCRQTLRKAAFSVQTFEDLSVEKEVRIRRQMAQKFNKRREDFKNLKDYNDYLETVEDLTFKLVNEIDVETTKQAIEKFASENRDLIRINADRLLNESRMATFRQDQLRKERQMKHEAYLRELEAEQAAKTEDRKLLIQELATSNKPAKTIIAAHQVSLKRTSMRKTEVKPNGGSTVGSSQLYSEPLWRLQQQEEDMDAQNEDDDMGEYDTLESMYMDVDLGVGYVKSVNNNKAHSGGSCYPLLTSSHGVKDIYVEPNNMPSLGKLSKAGGYRAGFGYSRAIEDAHTALYLPGL